MKTRLAIAKINYLENDAAPSTAERDAHHESGHCVVAIVLGVAIDSVRLCPGENPSGRFKFGIVRPDQRDAVVVVAKAGLLAETTFDPRTPQTRRAQDELIARRAMRGRYDLLFPAPRADYLRAAELEALKLVAANWETITALARELLAKRTLSGPEVEAFVRQRISGQPDTTAKSTAYSTERQTT
jgi:hypothetical protein